MRFVCGCLSSLSLASPNYKHLYFIPPKEVIHDLKEKNKNNNKITGEKNITKQDKIIERIKSLTKLTMVDIGYKIIKPDFIERDHRNNRLGTVITLERADGVR